MIKKINAKKGKNIMESKESVLATRSSCLQKHHPRELVKKTKLVGQAINRAKILEKHF